MILASKECYTELRKPAVVQQGRTLKPQVSFVPKDFAEQCIVSWLSRLSTHQEVEFIRDIRRYAKLFPHTPHACSCSGSGITSKALGSLYNVLNAKYGLSMTETHVLACEHKGPKQFFLRRQHPALLHLVSKLSELKYPTAECQIRGGQHCIKHYVKKTTGFPCTSRTTLSSQAAQNIDCVQLEKGETGIGFKEHFESHLEHWPEQVHNECVLGIRTYAKDCAPSHINDDTYILQKYRSVGYWALSVEMNNIEYGGLCERNRLWWIALMHLVGKKDEVDAHFLRTLQMFKVPVPLLDINGVIISDDEDLRFQISASEMHREM